MDLLRNSFSEPRVMFVRDQLQALEYLGYRSNLASRGVLAGQGMRAYFAKEVISRHLFPHLELESDMGYAKVHFIGYMVRRLLTVAVGRRVQDDRDNVSSRRVEFAGPLFASLFRALFIRVKNDVTRRMQNCVDHGGKVVFQRCFRSLGLTEGMEYSLATGNWGLCRADVSQLPGVSQSLQRLTYLSTLSHLRRVSNGLDGAVRTSMVRQLHGSQ